MTRLLSHRLLLTALAVSGVVAAASLATVGAANAAIVPGHSYSVRCPVLDYWGPRIVANQTWLDHQDGVGVSYVDSSGINWPTTEQFVYYLVWAYSYKYGVWYHSPMKRVLNGYPNGVVQVYSYARGQWVYADVGVDGADLAVGANAVSLRPSTGSGTWYIQVETYWTLPFTTLTANDMTNPNATPGGLNIYDSDTVCRF